MSWRSRLSLTEFESDLLLQIDAGELIDVTGNAFEYMRKFERFKLVSPYRDNGRWYYHPKLTDRGRSVVAGIKARRWVEGQRPEEDV